MKRYCCSTVSLLLAALILSTGCNSQSISERVMDPDADQALRNMSEKLLNMQHFAFNVNESMDERLGTGQCVEFTRRSKIYMSRPNMIFVDTEGDDAERSLWYNGESFTVLDKQTNQYARIEVPDRVDDMLDYVVAEYGLTIPMADLLSDDPYESLTSNVLQGTYLGLHEVAGRPCHHLSFQQEQINWQIWIDSGEDPLPRKLLIEYKQELDAPHFCAILTDWQVLDMSSGEQFTFQAPSGSQETEMAELIAIPPGEQP